MKVHLKFSPEPLVFGSTPIDAACGAAIANPKCVLFVDLVEVELPMLDSLRYCRTCLYKAEEISAANTGRLYLAGVVNGQELKTEEAA